MSRDTWWKPAKTKLQVVFRLQFHASHIVQTEWNNLFISFVPSGSSKAITKTNKANVRNGTCKWADPIYETTVLLQDPKTYQYDEKHYKLVVAKGKSRSSVLGEAKINLSDYVDASSPTIVALPLHGSDSGVILHVGVQLLTSKIGFRELEQQVSDGGEPVNTGHDGGSISTPENAVVPHADKVNPRPMFKPEPNELPSLEVKSSFSKGYGNLAGGFDGYAIAENHDGSRTRKIDNIKTIMSRNLKDVSPSKRPVMESEQFDQRFPSHSTIMDREMAIVHRENSRLQRELEAANVSIHELTKEISFVQNFANGLCFQAQQLTEQMAVEISSDKNLLKDVSMLKAECLRFKHDLEQLRHLKMDIPVPCRRHEDVNKECVILSRERTSETISLNRSNLMQRRFFKLLKEVDDSKTERENLVRKMDQMECYYEALIHDLEKNHKQILGELQNLQDEHSSCIYTISSTNAQMEAIRQQMNNEVLQLAEERNCLDVRNKKLQKKAATSELALNRVSMNYSVAVNQLQKDLGVLSSQIHSMYKTNEDLCIESQSCKVVLKNHQDVKSSVASQEDLYGKMQEQLSEIYLENINLDVLSVILHQALLKTALDGRSEKHELIEQLEHSCRKNQSLRLKLQTVYDEIDNLNKENAFCRSQRNDLDENLRRVGDENVVLSERIVGLESLVAENRNYKSKYESCEAEKAKLMNQLEQFDVEKHNLSNEVSLLREQVMTMKIQISENEKFHKLVNYIQGRLENLLVIGDDQASGLLSYNKKEKNTSCEKFMSNFPRLDECLQNLDDKVIQLIEENTNLLNERDSALVFFACAEGEVEVLKHKFEQDVVDMVRKLKVSSSTVEKIHIDLEAIMNRLAFSSEAEEKFIQMTVELLSDFTKLEAALQELTLDNKNLVERSIDELGGDKLTVDKLKESGMRVEEFDDLRITVESLKDETSLLRGVSDQLDAQILHLNIQLKDRGEKLAGLSQREDEQHHLKQKLLDEESEKLSLQYKFSHADAQLKKALEEISTYSESQSLEMHVVETVVMKQYELHLEELLQKIEGFQKNLEESDKNNLYLASRLNICCASKEKYAAENARLLSDLESLESNLEYNVAWSRALKHSNCSMAEELQAFMEKCELLEARCTTDENNNFEIENLIFSNQELEIRFMLLRTTFDEMSAQIISHEECSELTRKLSEQILKTEEFMNLSDHLKEEYEKREVEGSSFASQESLRVVFLKDQYETKLQETHHLLSVSEKHGEEILLKLQDTLDDLENRKKCEASILKRNEELILKIAELESENREIFAVFEQMKAEMECSDMSLACCKEEKNLLSVSLQECIDCKRKLEDEVDFLRGQTENLKTFMIRSQNRSSEDENLTENSVEASETKPTEELSGLRNSESDVKQSLDPLNDELKPQFMLSVIERLQNELEQMSSENTLLPREDNPDELESYDAIISELKEMHERYSQLSLDYAEVEGERQKLKLMLKNVRSSKKLFSRSLTSSLEELSA